MFTYSELQDLVPKKQRNVVTEELVEKINTIAGDPESGVEFKENMVSYNSVLSSGKFSIHEYLNAIKFVTHLLLQDHDIDAYEKVFPERYKRLIDKGVPRTKISSYATNYKQTKLVSQILEQTMVPISILNAPMYQEALNHSRHLMLHALSETVQQKAADSIMMQLKAPETAKLEVDIAINHDNVVKDNESIMKELAEKKLELMALGGDVKSIANMGVKNDIIEVEEIVCE